MNNPTKNIIDDHFQRQSNQDAPTGNKIQFIPIKQNLMSQSQVKTLKPYQHLNIDLTGSQFQKAGNQMLGKGHHMQSQPVLHDTRKSSLGPISPGAKSTNSNDSTGKQPMSGNYQQRMTQIRGENQGSYSSMNRKKQEHLKQLLTKQQSNRGNSFGYFKNTVSKQKNDKPGKILIKQDYEVRGKDQFSTLQNNSQHENKILKKSARGQRNLSAGGQDVSNSQPQRQAGLNTIDIRNEGRKRLDLDKKSQRSKSGSKNAGSRVKLKDFDKSQRSRSNSSNTRVKRLSTQMGTIEGYSNQQSHGTFGTYSINKPLKIDGAETFGQSQMQELTGSGVKAKSNTEYFKELYQKSCKIQNKVTSDIEESNKFLAKESIKSPSRQNDSMFIDLIHFPRISQKSRSFKEIADFLMKQLEFLQINGAFKRGPKGILKNGAQSNRSNSLDDKEELQNKSVINLKQIQEKRDLEHQVARLHSENKYCKMQNQNLQEQLKDLNLQFAKESQKFMKEFENQHKDMEQQFQSMQAQHLNQQHLTQTQAEVEIKEKTMEMDKYLNELRQCQQELKDLNNGKRTMRNFEQKNAMELRAELDFSKDQVASLEAEIRAMDVELEMLRGKQSQQRQLENEILALETANVQLKGKLDVLKNQKEFFENEYKIQQSQLERQNERLSQSPQGVPLPREKSPVPQTIHTLQTAIGNNMNYLNELQKAKSRSRSGGDRVEQFRDTRSRSPQEPITYQKMVSQQSIEDSRKVQQNQAKMIEKLLLKIKKMKQHQVDEDFAIFNLNNDLQAAKSSHQMQSTKEKVFMDNYNVELKTYKDNIQELYDAMMLQCENKINKQSDYTEQFHQLKSYLKLQHQLGNLRKYRFDEKFQTLLNIPKLICIADQFNQNEQAHHDGKVYLNKDRLIQQKNTTFQHFYQQVMDSIGQFYVMHQQINLYRNKSNQLQINLDCYKEMQMGTDDPQSQYEARMVKSLQVELDKKVQEVIELNRTVEVLKSESEIPEEVFKQIVAAIISDKIQICHGQLISPEDTQKLGLNKQVNSSDQNNRNNRFSTKNFVNKPPQPQVKNKKLRGMSAGKSQSHSKIFGGKKPWLDLDPCIQTELDRLKSYEMEYDVVEKERDLYQGEYNKQRKDNEELAEQIKVRTQEFQELDLHHQEQMTKLTEAKEKILNLELECERYEKKVTKLSDLNEELRVLIEQERDMYLDEIETVKNSCEKKIKSKTSQDILVRNKLMQLATHYRIFIASSFNVEQILDSILEQIGTKSTIRRAQPTQLQRPFAIQEQSPRNPALNERQQSADLNQSPEKDYQTPAMAPRQQSQTREPRFEQNERQAHQYVPAQRNEMTGTRSISKKMDKIVSSYEEDLRKIEAMKQQNLNQKYHKDLFNSKSNTQLIPQNSPSKRQRSQDIQRSPERAEQFSQQNIQRSPSARGYSRNQSTIEESLQYNNNADQLEQERKSPEQEFFEDDYEVSYTKKAREQLAKVRELDQAPPQYHHEEQRLPREQENISYQQEHLIPERGYSEAEHQNNQFQTEQQDVIYRHQKRTQNTFLKNLHQEISYPQQETYKHDVLSNKRDIIKLQKEHEQMKIRKEQQKILNNERNNFQEKLQNLRKKLNGPSVTGSLGSTTQLPSLPTDQDQFKDTLNIQNHQTFLKPDQSPQVEKDMFSPQQNSQLEQSINQRLREFENEQMQRQAQLASRQ